VLTNSSVLGAGLGLRRALMAELETFSGQLPDFMEVAPENWVKMGGRYRRRFETLAERFPLVSHGLSLSLGAPDPLDWELLRDIKSFHKRYGIQYYTEHLSYCSDGGHLYDLMPMPFTCEAVDYVADRIRQVQDFLGERIGIENISYYAAPDPEIPEIDFIRGVVLQADCHLMLDVNNVYVNSVNHGYDPYQFIRQLPGERVCYIHVAGHYDEAPDLKVDTHGADVVDPVWDLLGYTYSQLGILPTLLERDFNFPPLPRLLEEVSRIRELQHCSQIAEWQRGVRS
jgi:uncharacterized protein